MQESKQKYTYKYFNLYDLLWNTRIFGFRFFFNVVLIPMTFIIETLFNP